MRLITWNHILTLLQYEILVNHLIYHQLVHLIYHHYITRSHGKAKKTKEREPFYKKGDGVVYLPGDIKGLTKKLHLLAAELFAGNTTVRSELVHVLYALLRLKQLTCKESADITARLAASL